MEYTEKSYDVDPYILGVLIGDGSLTGNVAIFSNPDVDSQIASNVERLLPNGYA
jgi:hypothetical protein